MKEIPIFSAIIPVTTTKVTNVIKSTKFDEMRDDITEIFFKSFDPVSEKDNLKIWLFVEKKDLEIRKWTKGGLCCADFYCGLINHLLYFDIYLCRSDNFFYLPQLYIENYSIHLPFNNIYKNLRNLRIKNQKIKQLISKKISFKKINSNKLLDVMIKVKM